MRVLYPEFVAVMNMVLKGHATMLVLKQPGPCAFCHC